MLEWSKKRSNFFVAPSWDTLSIDKVNNGYCINLNSVEIKTIRHPILFVRKYDNWGVLRLNFCTYYGVSLDKMDDLTPASFKNVELLISSGKADKWTTSKVVPVSYVLQFPELYELILRHSKRNYITLADRRAGAENTDIEKAGPDTADTKNKIDCDDLFPVSTTEEKKNGCPIPRVLYVPDPVSAECKLEQWLSERPNFTLIRSDADPTLCLVTDQKNFVFVVYLFDQKEEWLADEEIFSDELPLYFSETTHVTSPVFTAAAVADYLKCHTELTVQVCVLFGDHTKIINAEDMYSEWYAMRIAVCSCNCNYKTPAIRNFNYVVEDLLKTKKKFSKKQIATIQEKFLALNRWTLKRALWDATRMTILKKNLSSDYTAREIVKTWIEGNYSGCILLGRYVDLETGYLFNLVYNFSQVAVFLENDIAAKSCTPVEGLNRICEKLRTSGTKATLTPCIVSRKRNMVKPPQYMKNFDAKSLFKLEQVSYTREMGYEKSEKLKRDEVRALIQFANDHFCHEEPRVPEVYGDELEAFLIDEMRNMEQFFLEKKLFYQYCTTTFTKSVWTLVQMCDGGKRIFQFRAFEMSGPDFEAKLERTQKRYADELSFSREHLPSSTNLEMIVVVPDCVAHALNCDCLDEDDVFYVRRSYFRTLLSEKVLE